MTLCDYITFKYCDVNTKKSVSMKTKMNLLKKLNKDDLPFIVVVDKSVGNIIIEYLHRVVKLYRHSLH